MKNMKCYLYKHKGVICIYMLIMILQCAFGALSTIYSAKFLSTLTMFEFDNCVKYLIIASAMLTCNYLCWWSGGHIYSKFSNIIWAEIASDLTKRGFELTSSSFTEHNVGGFVNRILKDPLEVLQQMSDLVATLVELIMSLIVVVYMISLNYIIGISYIVVLFVLCFIEAKRRAISSKYLSASKKVEDETDSVISEIIKSQKDIKTLSMELELSKISSKKLDVLKNVKMKHDVTDNNFWSIRNVLLNVFTTLILVMGLYMVKYEYIVVSTLILVFTYKDDVFGLIWNIGNVSKNFVQAKISSDRMFDLYNEELYQSESFGDKNVDNIVGNIEFNKVKFSYSDLEEVEEVNKNGKKETKLKKMKKDSLFDCLSFKIPANMTVAFVGKSGSGKSTIVELISKLIECDEGEVLLDGHDVKTLSKDTLRNNIAMINQFPYIFDMSVKENLLLIKPDASDEEIWEALKQASLDSDVRKMSKGLDTKLGETGIKLSGGQRQRLAIARALLKKSKIIIFDESTSSLDNFTQSDIQETIDNLKGKHTIIMVAHRLSTIKNADRIYFLREGEIVSEGTFDELFDSNDEFRRMFLIENIKNDNL